MLQRVPHLRDDCSSGWSFVNVWRLAARGAPVGGRTPVGRSDVELRCECAGAGVVKRAVQAVRLASMAYGTTVQYQPVRQIRPLLGWEACGDLTFNGLGVRRAARPIRTPAQSTGHTNHMRVNRKTRHAKSVPKHHIRGFAPHARQTCQRVHILRHFAIEPFAQCVRKSDDVLCFRMMKPDRMNDAFHVFGIGARKCVWSWIFVE